LTNRRDTAHFSRPIVGNIGNAQHGGDTRWKRTWPGIDPASGCGFHAWLLHRFLSCERYVAEESLYSSNQWVW